MKANYRKRTRYIGVFERTSKERTHKGKPDTCFDICFKLNGRLIWEKVGWASEGYSAKLASEVRSERIRNIRHGKELPRQKRNVSYFKEVASKYMQWAAENKKSSRDDINRYENHLAVRFDNKRLNEISSFDLERLKSDLSKKGLSPKTVKHVLTLFRQIVNKAILWKMWEGHNPIKDIKMPTVQNQRERFLNYGEANLLLNELRKVSKQLHDISLLSLHTGLRAGEIFNLKRQDLDFNNEIINVSDPKNKEGRKAFMTKSVKKILLERVSALPDEYIFLSRDGKKINEVSNTFNRAVNRLGFNKGIKDRRQKLTFHSLRHSFASMLALQGESLLTIRELMGHKSLAMVQRYSHLIPNEKRKATLALEKVLTRKEVDGKSWGLPIEKRV
jgi:integrase